MAVVSNHWLQGRRQKDCNDEGGKICEVDSDGGNACRRESWAAVTGSGDNVKTVTGKYIENSGSESQTFPMSLQIKDEDDDDEDEKWLRKDKKTVSYE